MPKQNINFEGATFSGGVSLGNYTGTVSNVNVTQVHRGEGDNIAGDVSINQVLVSQVGSNNTKNTVKVSNTINSSNVSDTVDSPKTILVKNKNGKTVSMVTGLKSGTIEIQDGETITTFSFD